MHVEKLKNKIDWKGFLQASPEGTFYHSLKWKEVIQKSFPCSALYLTIKDANGTIVGICPGFILDSAPLKIFCSIPYSDYGGPVIASHCIERASVSLRSFLEEFCSNNDIAYAKFCLIHFREYSRGIILNQPLSTICPAYYTYPVFFCVMMLSDS